MKQFNFSQNWKRKVVSAIDLPRVQRALLVGMSFQIDYEPGNPPWTYSRELLTRPPAKDTLPWYQCNGRCHYIAPFCLTLGEELFRNLNWGILSGDFHSVAIGYENDWETPEVVMDILAFKYCSAEDSIQLVKCRNFAFYSTLPEYFVSFVTSSTNKAEILEVIKTTLGL